MTGYRLQIVRKIDSGLIIALLLTLFAIQPLLRPGLPTSADLAIHLHRTMEFERAWAAGVIVPWWAPNLAFGYGYPLFLFAPPLPYILGTALHLAGFNIGLAFKLLLMLCFLLYAAGTYLLARELFSSAAAGLVAATAYTFAPFALREALLEGGNLPQLLAIGLFPWPLWAATRAVRRASWGWTILAGIFYAAIMLSHLFQAFVFSPLFGAYILLGLILYHRTRANKVGPSLLPRLRALLAPVLGLLLSAFFWLPAFVERHFTRAQADIYLQKSPFFIRYPYWPELVAWIQPLDTRAANPNTPLTLGVITLILAGLGLLLALFKIWQQFTRSPSKPAPTPTPALLFFALVAAAATFLTLPVSRPVWETFAILQVAEFPWRMLGLANLGLAILAGAAILWLPARLRRLATGLCLTLQLVGVAPYLYPVIPFTRYGPLTVADQINYERSSQSIGTTTLGEYLPQTVTDPPTSSPLVDTLQAGKLPERLDRSRLPAGATAQRLAQTAVTHRYRLNSPAPFTLRLFQFDFPGWQARLNGRPLPIRPEPNSGLILVDIPAGPQTLTLRFGATPIRTLALGTTGLTLLALAMAAIVSIKKRAQPSRAASGDSLPLLGGLGRGSIFKGHAAPPPRSPNTIPLLIALVAIPLAALWLKPLLRPIFTVTSPPEQVLPAQHQTDIRFSNGIRLVGYDVSRRVVPAGDYLQVVLYWQTAAAPHRVNLQPFVHLDRLDTLTTMAGTTNYTPGDITTETVLPTFHWDNSRYVRDEHDLIIPPDAPPTAYALRVGLIDPDQAHRLVPLARASGDTAQIDTINVSPAGPPPQLAQPLDVPFTNNSDTIRLTGFERVGQTPDRLDFKLTWQSEQTPGQNYTIFTQLLDSSGKLITSFDRPPLDGAYPTATWLPHQTILDPRYIPLADVPSGQYRLIVGLYQATSQQRLRTPGGTNFVELAEIDINKP